MGKRRKLVQEPISCSRCSVFESSFKVPQYANITRKSILYNLESSDRLLPKNHILFRSKAASDIVIKQIFALPNISITSHTSKSQSSGSTCLYTSLRRNLKNLHYRAYNCKFEILLDKHCPIPTDSAGYNTTNQVTFFVYAACQSIFPADLLCSSSATRKLRSNISAFVRQQRFESFTLKQCMSKLKMSDFPILPKKCVSDSLRSRLFERWIFWFFSSIVTSIIKANFYVTEGEDGNQELFFYRKSVWKKIISDQGTGLSCENDQVFAQTHQEKDEYSFPTSQGVALPPKIRFEYPE